MRTKERDKRSGKVLVLFAILLPTLIGITGMVIDGGVMMSECRNLQHAADAASTAAAMKLSLGKGTSVAVATAIDVVQNGNEMGEASVTVNIPPTSGAYAGQANHVEVFAEQQYESYLMRVFDGGIGRTMRARSVAAVRDATAGAAIVILDPDPADSTLDGTGDSLGGISVNDLSTAMATQTGASAYLSPIPIVGPIAAGLVNASLNSLLPTLVPDALNAATADAAISPLPTLVAGLEVEGVGQLVVDGAIHVNTEWGGVDENGEVVGNAAGPPYALACQPILTSTRIRARHSRGQWCR